MRDGKEVRPREAWTKLDLMVLGGLAGIAAIAIALGFAGASRVQPVAGLALILALAYCLSSARHFIDYRTVAWGLGLQFVFALVVLKTDAGRAVFQSAGGVITQILNFAYVG
ncbi:MAG TPA: Na+ dependent nucleoside transporter N-terminal domain-containing protein, partial [Vicinamibacterales bacterium]|nr:Na+ dependent nucleoside transporter N-terminal domain-containing protein [Vicinamibacterales bacterium]